MQSHNHIDYITLVWTLCKLKLPSGDFWQSLHWCNRPQDWMVGETMPKHALLCNACLKMGMGGAGERACPLQASRACETSRNASCDRYVLCIAWIHWDVLYPDLLPVWFPRAFTIYSPVTARGGSRGFTQTPFLTSKRFYVQRLTVGLQLGLLCCMTCFLVSTPDIRT